MRKLIKLILILFPFSIIGQNTSIPDANFEQALINLGYDTNLDGLVSTVNIMSVINLDVSSSNIADLTGIEDFAVLQELDCSNNSLTSLNMNQNLNLMELDCSDNNLASLDVSSNTMLSNLDCDTNNLSTLDVTQNMILQTLSCSYNYLNSLDVTQNISLTSLNCIYNFMVYLDVSANTKLEYLNCGYNNLTELDVSQNIVLTELYCQHNSLRCLNVSNGNNLNIIGLTPYFNSLLTCIEVDDAVWASATWNNTYGAIPGVSFYFDSQSAFSDNCNNQCSSNTITAISDISPKIKISPNPFSTNTRIFVPSEIKGDLTLYIYDLLGNLVKFQNNISSEIILLNRHEISSGIYVVRIQSEEYKYEQKLIVD